MTNFGHDMNDDLLVSYLLNEGDEADWKRVEDWIKRDPENKRYFENFRTIWQAAGDLELPGTVDENTTWQRFQARTTSQQPAIIRQLAPLRKLYRIAAIIVSVSLLIAAAYFVWDYADHSPVTLAAAAQTEVKTLPDGSEVTLNKNSSIRYTRKLRGEKRKIELEGEAFFKVTADKNKPFVVDVNDVRITVIGTSFNVKDMEGETEVIVETGKVQVEAGGKSLLLNPGESAKIDKYDSVYKEKITDKLYSYYVSKEFVCDNTPLWKLVAVLNEAYQANIIITNPELRQLPLTTTFHNESLENILEVISETFNITITRDGDRILMN